LIERVKEGKEAFGSNDGGEEQKKTRKKAPQVRREGIAVPIYMTR